jgi:hypothetical protein
MNAEEKSGAGRSEIEAGQEEANERGSPEEASLDGESQIDLMGINSSE